MRKGVGRRASNHVSAEAARRKFNIPLLRPAIGSRVHQIEEGRAREFNESYGAFLRRNGLLKKGQNVAVDIFP